MPRNAAPAFLMADTSQRVLTAGISFDHSGALKRRGLYLPDALMP